MGSNYDYGSHQQKDMSAEEISKILNKKMTIFGFQTEEFMWAVARSGPVFFVFFLTAVIFKFIALQIQSYWISEAVTTIFFGAFIALFVSTIIHLFLLRRIQKLFGKGVALISLSTTTMWSIFTGKAKKNYGFKIIPNNNFQRME